jgi:hypothetical protein
MLPHEIDPARKKVEELKALQVRLAELQAEISRMRAHISDITNPPPQSGLRAISPQEAAAA